MASKNVDPRLETPNMVKITMVSTLIGVNVALGTGASRADPYGEATIKIAYTNLDQALADLPSQVQRLINKIQEGE